MNTLNAPQASTLDSPELAPRVGPLARPSRAVPGPRGPLSGFRIVRKPIEHTSVDFKRYGDVVGYRIGTMRIFLVVHPDGVKHVLQENHRNYVKSPDYKILKRVLGEGLLTSENPLWLSQRRLMTPMFHRQRIAEFGATMVDSTLKMLDKWSSLAGEGATFDVCNEMMQLTLEIVARVLFKVEIAGELAHEIGHDVTVTNERLGQFDLGTLLPWLPTRRNREFRRAIRSFDALIAGMIADHRRHGEDRGDMLSLLLAARDEDTGEAMSDKQVRDEALTLIAAGHETTANALAWTWYLLSQNPAVEQKLHAELAAVLGGRAPTVADLPNLRYTSMVIDESMRLYPPAWSIGRSPLADDEVLGFSVPKGASVMLSQWLTHRHPDFWENPERFDPDRFSPERSANRPRYAYFPFGGGPRLCIGNTFALTEANLILAAIAQKFRLRMVPGHPVELQPLVTLRPRYGLKMTVDPAQS
ncbi:MAG: cytochrome P450 [Candidatus Binatus sp.]|uniref:cytochrome P450 n=1 Tax=Candidatus Binatus sp. TaxID=2811406 RepID=UPI003C70D6E0